MQEEKQTTCSGGGCATSMKDMIARKKAEQAAKSK